MNVRLWIADLPVRLRSIIRRARVERDLADELSFHPAMQARVAREAGLNKAEAVRRARLDFRRLTQTKERCRDRSAGALSPAVAGGSPQPVRSPSQ